jgi:hypothetical protein
MINQSELIHSRDWDILFIIDACRYDIFKAIYKDVFGERGTLIETSSPTTFSLGWFIETFHDKPKLDVCFIACDYEVNSKGISNKKIYDRGKRKKYGHVKFDARDCFSEIIDLWDFGLDKELGVVTPERLCEEVSQQVKLGKRVIGNFWQVHDPYLFYSEHGLFEPDNTQDKYQRENYRYNFVNLKKFIRNIFSDEFTWYIKNIILSKPSGLYAIWKVLGKNGIKRGYESDLYRTLRQIKKVSDNFPDKNIAVTSDHGELLGENGNYGHFGEHPILHSVPWFEIRRKNSGDIE